MIENYLGNDVYEYTLSSGKTVELSQDELRELTGYVNNVSEYKIRSQHYVGLYKKVIRDLEKANAELGRLKEPYSLLEYSNGWMCK